MTAKQVLSAGMLLALVSGISAAPAAAQEPRGPRGPLDVYASLNRAVARAVADDPAQPARPASRASNQSGSTKGSGGHTAMIISLVGAAAGIGATVYMVKQMQKDTKTLPTPY